jgi:hypothetical protein
MRFIQRSVQLHHAARGDVVQALLKLGRNPRVVMLDDEPGDLGTFGGREFLERGDDLLCAQAANVPRIVRGRMLQRSQR